MVPIPSSKSSLTLDVQAVGIFHMNSRIQNFINDLEEQVKDLSELQLMNTKRIPIHMRRTVIAIQIIL